VVGAFAQLDDHVCVAEHAENAGLHNLGDAAPEAGVVVQCPASSAS
jgi:hypothetical protein